MTASEEEQEEVNEERMNEMALQCQLRLQKVVYMPIATNREAENDRSSSNLSSILNAVPNARHAFFNHAHSISQSYAMIQISANLAKIGMSSLPPSMLGR
eukprot:scaffold3282_cov198-Alexandrium_tamarense.AAC.36